MFFFHECNFAKLDQPVYGQRPQTTNIILVHYLITAIKHCLPLASLVWTTLCPGNQAGREGTSGVFWQKWKVSKQVSHPFTTLPYSHHQVPLGVPQRLSQWRNLHNMQQLFGESTLYTWDWLSLENSCNTGSSKCHRQVGAKAGVKKDRALLVWLHEEVIGVEEGIGLTRDSLSDQCWATTDGINSDNLQTALEPFNNIRLIIYNIWLILCNIWLIIYNI